uniref:Cilia- and flagella-associated protein 45 n=1 Tax=Fibrocapsa japonica TaxID=94617 RepID=A0A7S2V0X2_9STRA|mmetsp:Transcript_2388/g.3535  ORF Transcript_2388/g.3535 Transcript_2388/m.3535 type:complete len:289 (+) Transcript_2388:1-867(+)
MQQMQDRQRRKLLEEEAREQENQAMLAMMRKFEDDDRSKQMKHKEEVRQARLEVLSANERAIQMREHMKIKEREEEEAILAYQAKKDEDLRVREQEEIVRQRLMKERQAKLLAQQEKTQNKQAELDELRARRAAEEKERRERARELAAAQKHRHDIACLQEDRKRQEQQKRFMQMKEAEQQIQEYQAAMAYSNQVAEREREEFQRKQHASMDHRSAILTQINEAEAKRSQEQNAKFEEGRKLNQEFLSERAKLEAIRDKMVSDLEKKGINPKYLAEMKMADIRKLQMR